MSSPDRKRVVTLPLVMAAAVAASHFGLQGLERRYRRQHHTFVVHGRGCHLDLIHGLPKASQGKVVKKLRREVQQAKRTGLVINPLLLGAIETCGSPEPAERCKRAVSRLREWHSEVQRYDKFWTYLCHMGLLGLVALLGLVVGVVVVRRARGRAVGLALVGTAAVLGGTCWRMVQVTRLGDRLHQAYLEDHSVSWARLALMLPADLRGRELPRAAAMIESLSYIEPEQREQLRVAVRDCLREPVRCGRVLVPLGRIHAIDPAARHERGIRAWLTRWLLWIGAGLLLLVPLANRKKERPDD